MIQQIKNSYILDLLVNLYIRANISFRQINGNLKLKYQWKRRIYMLRYLNRNQHENGTAYKRQVRDFLISNFQGYRDISWSLCYAAINGIHDHRYIPDDIYYDYIEKRLNHLTLLYAHNDKNMLKKHFKNAKMPSTLFRIMNGRFYDENYNPTGIEDTIQKTNHLDRIVFKPSIESGGGRNVMIDPPKAIFKHLESLFQTVTNRNELNYIGQQYLVQHQRFSSFHPQSVNTMRIMTLRLGDEIVLLSPILRMGRGTNKVDNQMSGGIVCGITTDGKLKKYAYDKKFKRYEKHPDTGVIFEGTELPLYAEAISMVKDLHREVIYFDIISWDIAVGQDDNVYLIEVNLGWQGINSHQICNGPLFGEYTESALIVISGKKAVWTTADKNCTDNRNLEPCNL